ncbi:MAG: alpha/beta hydrolase [Myxococcota bacterium]
MATLTAVESSNGQLRVDDGGAGGVPVVFVHGLGGRSELWGPAVGAVRAMRRAVAYDLRGHGASDVDGSYAIGDHVTDLGRVVDAIGAPKVVLVGHSSAGALLMVYASRHPAKVAGAVYVDAVAGRPGGTPASEYAGLLDAASRPDGRRRWYEALLENARPATRARVLASLDATPGDVFVDTARAMFTFDPRPYLKSKVLRGAIVAGEGDDPDLAHQALAIRDVHVLYGVSHWLMLDDPGRFEVALVDLLAGFPG